MQENEINKLITQLTAIYNFARDIHYNCGGENFYGNHLFADRISNNLEDFLDQIKEICLLGNGIAPKKSKEYLKEAIYLIPDNVDFKSMAVLLTQTLNTIEKINSVSKGDENVLANIAQDIQNKLGLLNIMFGD